MSIENDLAYLRARLQGRNLDALARVEAEIARLERENENNAAAFELAMRQSDAAEAEVARLRDGLRQARAHLPEQPNKAKRLLDALLAEDDAAQECPECGHDAHSPGYCVMSCDCGAA